MERRDERRSVAHKEDAAALLLILLVESATGCGVGNVVDVTGKTPVNDAASTLTKLYNSNEYTIRKNDVVAVITKTLPVFFWLCERRF